MEQKLYELRREIEGRDEMNATLKEEIESLHDTINKERIVASKTLVQKSIRVENEFVCLE